MTEDQPAVLTPQEIADEQRINVATVTRAIRNSRLRAQQIGRQWRIRREDYDTWLANGAPTQKQEPTE
jgi:excisionase family DNA binding protein